MNYNHHIIRQECQRLFEIDKFEELKNKTVFVVGANGLIGSFLADFMVFLNENDYNISLILSSYSAPDKAVRILHLQNRDDVRYFSWDCSKPLPQNALKEEIDVTFFCAGYGQPSKFLSNNIKTTLINIVGANSILDKLSRQEKDTKFTFLSTSEIYGTPSVYPTPEEYPCQFDLSNNRVAYILSKATAENLCVQYNKLEHLETKIARIALTYGPGTMHNDSRVMQEFIFKAAKNGNISMLDSGSSIRNYLYLTDSAEAILNVTLRGQSIVYNIGGDSEEVSIYGLAKHIGALMGTPVIKGEEKNKNTKSAPLKVGLSMKKYRKEFPKYGNNIIGLSQGIDRVLKWYRLMEVENE